MHINMERRSKHTVKWERLASKQYVLCDFIFTRKNVYMCIFVQIHIYEHVRLLYLGEIILFCSL